LERLRIDAVLFAGMLNDFESGSQPNTNLKGELKVMATKTTTRSINHATKAGTQLVPAEKKDALATRPSAKLEKKDTVALDFATPADHGFSREDLAIPRITILQSGSPQLKKSEGQYIKGAEEGDFFDSISNSIMAKGEEGFIFIPVSFRVAFIEWKPDRGGFVADHGDNAEVEARCTVNDKGARINPEGNEIVKTYEYYALAVVKGEVSPRQVVVSLSKTQLKKGRKLNSVIQLLQVETPEGLRNPKMYYSCFDAASVPESNDKGNWMGWSFIRKGATHELLGMDTYEAARGFHQAVSSGQVRAAAPVDDHVFAPAGDSEQL
jgi:hypothetical protein